MTPRSRGAARCAPDFEGSILVLTAHADALAEPAKLGADAIIGKPFDVEALLAKIEDLLAS